MEYAEQAYRRDEQLLAQDVLPRDQYLDKKKTYQVCRRD